MSVDTDKMIAALRAGSHWSDFPNEETGQVLIDCMLGILDALSEHLDEPVTLGSFARVKALIAQHMLDTEYNKKMIGVMPPAYCLALPDELIEAGVAMLHTAIEMLGTVAENPEAFLAQKSLDEDTFFSHPHLFNFSEEIMTLYRAGKLTFARLLELDPQPLVEMG